MYYPSSLSLILDMLLKQKYLAIFLSRFLKLIVEGSLFKYLAMLLNRFLKLLDILLYFLQMKVASHGTWFILITSGLPCFGFGVCCDNEVDTQALFEELNAESLLYGTQVSSH